jgi:hypothetical protein
MIIYALTAYNQIVYIGLTSNIKQRLTAHKKDKAFDNYLIVDEAGDRETEYLCINELKPYYNKIVLNVKLGILTKQSH